MPMDQNSNDNVCAERLRMLRAKRGCSQADVAEHVGVSQNAVGKWERSESQPQASELARLADYYAVAADFLIGRTDSPTGLTPDTWIVDLDVYDSPKEGAKWAAKIPRRLRIVEFDEMQRLKDALDARLRGSTKKAPGKRTGGGRADGNA